MSFFCFLGEVNRIFFLKKYSEYLADFFGHLSQRAEIARSTSKIILALQKHAYLM